MGLFNYFRFTKETIQVLSGFGSGLLANLGSETVETLIESTAIAHPALTGVSVVANTLISAGLTVGAAYLGYQFSGYIANKTCCPPADEEELRDVTQSSNLFYQPPEKTKRKEAIQVTSAAVCTVATSFVVEAVDAGIEIATQHQGFEWLSVIPSSFIDTTLLLGTAYLAYQSAGYIADKLACNKKETKYGDYFSDDSKSTYGLS